MKQKKALTFIFSGVAAVLLVVGVSVILLVLKDKPEARKRQVQMVTLVKPPPPPPPPEIQEQPPEPEEVMEEPAPEEAPREEAAEDLDAPPPGELLGLDAEGGSGSDGFGLAARKGGRSLIGGDGGKDLLRKFAWYTAIVREELENLVRRHLEEHGGIPRGELQTVVKIQLDEQGKVSAYKIEGSSGNPEMDKAVAQILERAAVNEPPPSDMPKVIKLKISSQG